LAVTKLYDAGRTANVRIVVDTARNKEIEEARLLSRARSNIEGMALALGDDLRTLAFLNPFRS
jgi:hypothetical protein